MKYQDIKKVIKPYECFCHEKHPSLYFIKIPNVDKCLSLNTSPLYVHDDLRGSYLTCVSGGTRVMGFSRETAILNLIHLHKYDRFNQLEEFDLPKNWKEFKRI